MQVTGDRMYNEGLIGAMTGIAGLAIITWTNAWEAYSASNLWLLGVVVPAGASIVLVQRLPWIQQAWHKYLQAGEQDRCPPDCRTQNLSSLKKGQEMNTSYIPTSIQ